MQYCKAKVESLHLYMKSEKSFTLPVILITALFFLWGFVHNLNPILIPHLKKACQLSDAQSALIDSSFFIAYFLVALPAGIFIKRYSYKGGIVLGLLLFAFGAFLFYPAASVRSFAFFLAALFIIASGLTFLETAANPYINALGRPETATTRLNFAQSFNGLAATLAPYIGGTFILSGKTLADADQNMPQEQINAFLDKEASAVQVPYLVIGAVVLLVALLIWRTPLPNITEKEDGAVKSNSTDSIFKEKRLMMGVVAQFFYVGAQVCVGSFFIRYASFAAGIGEKVAATTYLTAALFAFMGGRFIGTFLMRFIAPARLLFAYSVISILLLLAVVLHGRMPGVYALIGVQFCMSIMFPTIFSLSLQGLGSKTKKGSSLLIMSIVGGALLPLVMGLVSDRANIQYAYIVPAICFVVVGYFALREMMRQTTPMLNIQPMHP